MCKGDTMSESKTDETTKQKETIAKQASINLVKMFPPSGGGLVWQKLQSSVWHISCRQPIFWSRSLAWYFNFPRGLGHTATKPLAGSPRFVRLLEPMLDYFQYEEISETGDSHLLESCHKEGKQFIFACQPHGVVSQLSVCIMLHKAFCLRRWEKDWCHYFCTATLTSIDILLCHLFQNCWFPRTARGTHSCGLGTIKNSNIEKCHGSL